jgi:hypothetical protein
VSALDPAVIVAGLMDEMAGAGAVPPPPADPSEPEPEAELPPPHPFTKAATPRTKTKARKRTEKSQNLHNSWTLSKGPTFPNALNSITEWVASSNITPRDHLPAYFLGLLPRIRRAPLATAMTRTDASCII